MLPQEVELWYVLPAIRSGIAKELAKLGLKQREIAKKLSITESAVSQYVKGKRAKDADLGREIESEIALSAKGLGNGKTNITRESVRLCNLIRKSGALCKIHRMHSCESESCEVCLG